MDDVMFGDRLAFTAQAEAMEDAVTCRELGVEIRMDLDEEFEDLTPAHLRVSQAIDDMDVDLEALEAQLWTSLGFRDSKRGWAAA